MPNDKIQLGGSAGGIVEEGSNSNGTWVKWDTGLMICKHEMTIPEITSTIGALYRSSGAGTWTYPQAFVGAFPAFNANDKNSSQIWVATNTTLSSGDMYGFFTLSLAGSRTVIVTAIGRWK